MPNAEAVISWQTQNLADNIGQETKMQDSWKIETELNCTRSDNLINFRLESAETRSQKVRDVIEVFVDNPPPEFVEFVLSCGAYEGNITPSVISCFTPIIKEQFDAVIAEKYTVKRKD